MRRSIIKDIETSLEKDDFTVQIIHSNLGNGKTCLIEYLMCFFSDKYDVYYFKQLYDDLEQELRIIYSSHYFSNYNWKKVVKLPVNTILKVECLP